MMMDVRAIRTEADYDWALREIGRYFESEPARGSPEAERFDVLAALIEVYEARHWPVEAADAVDLILHKMDVSGLTQADLAKVLGSGSRASEILARKRPITMDMAYRLNRDWGIPAEVLIHSSGTGTAA
jgi:HTH-type transcriptional regulator/antitoxin HigA